MSFSCERLIEALTALPSRHRAAFAASASERQFPNYEAFTAESGCGDPSSLREGLDVAWATLESGTLDGVRCRELMDRAEGVAPNSEDFTALFTGPASDAALAVCHTLECCVTGDPKPASYTGDSAASTIGIYLQEVAGVGVYGYSRFLPKAQRDADLRAEGDYANRWEDTSPLMLAELLAQDEDLAALRAAPTLTPELLRTLRERSQKGGIQPFERGLFKRENIPANPRPVPPPMFCDVCEGEGGTEQEPCERCGGTGRVRNRLARDADG
jgi:hypothetical protein